MSTHNDHIQQWTLPSGATVEFTSWSLQEARQSELNQQLQQAGIELTLGRSAQLEQAVSEAIVNILTPEQRQLWQRYEGNQAAQGSGNEITVQRDRTIEAELKQAFRDAGVPLTSEQEARLEQIDQQMSNDLGQVFRSNPLQAIGQLLASFFLPQPLAARLFGESAVGRSVGTYIQEINAVLTPEQQQVWDRYWCDRQEKRL